MTNNFRTRPEVHSLSYSGGKTEVSLSVFVCCLAEKNSSSESWLRWFNVWGTFVKECIDHVQLT